MIDATPSHAVLREFFDNSSLTWGLMACGVAQLSKLFLELLLHRRWRPAVLIETGGMPSSHCVIHLDVDNFYCAVELADDPSLAGRPVAPGRVPSRRSMSRPRATRRRVARAAVARARRRPRGASYFGPRSSLYECGSIVSPK